jgi:hypothetical protein
MTFRVETIRSGDPVESTPDYQQAQRLHAGRSFTRRVADPERGATLYCLSVNDFEERPPGEYVLFFKGHITKVFAHEKGETVPEIGRVVTYRISRLDIPPELMDERPQVLELLQDALTARGLGGALPTASVRIEFKNQQGDHT